MTVQYKWKKDLIKLEAKADEGAEFSDQMKSVFTNNESYDVELQVEGKLIPANKGILKARCPFFKDMFASLSPVF